MASARVETIASYIVAAIAVESTAERVVLRIAVSIHDLPRRPYRSGEMLASVEEAHRKLRAAILLAAFLLTLLAAPHRGLILLLVGAYACART